MVRAVLRNGEIQPLGPLPADWQDGQELLVEIETVEFPDEISAWMQEIEETAQAIPEDDQRIFLQALEKQKAIAKEQVREQMELP